MATWEIWHRTGASARRTRTSWVVVLGLSLFSLGCEGEEREIAPGVLDRETFVEVYVALRMQALEMPDANLLEEDRERILGEYQVSADDLVAFAEAHGRNPDYMLEVWRDIESRLNIPVDSTAEDSN